MKPTRVRMTHSLVMNYGLYKKMEIYVRALSSAVLVYPIILTLVASVPNQRRSGK